MPHSTVETAATSIGDRLSEVLARDVASDTAVAPNKCHMEYLTKVIE